MLSSIQTKRRTSGFIYAPFMLAIAVVCLVVLILLFRAQQHNAHVCESNLHQIYAALELYEIEYGSLPSLAFFPDDPRQDEDSLRAFLEKQGLGGSVCLCPSSPDVIRDTGLSYLWNVELNGQKLGRLQAKWMLVEINALSGQVPAPHRGHYHVLYTDGHVERRREPPPGSLAKRLAL